MDASPGASFPVDEAGGSGTYIRRRSGGRLGNAIRALMRSDPGSLYRHPCCDATQKKWDRSISRASILQKTGLSQFSGTAAVAIATASAVPGTLVNQAAGGGDRTSVTFGHPSGTLQVGAEARQVKGQWTATKAVMSRSARVLMEGGVKVPGDAF